MFEQIKESLSSDKKDSSSGNGLYKEILKFSAGNTYQVRLLPNPTSPKDSIFRYYNHGWTSNATGKYVTALCPTTFGEQCPIDTYYLKTYRNGTEAEKESAKVLSRKENWMVNVYVISDPENPENEGKVKILRYGKELAKIIDSALEGDDAAEFGVEKVFDVVEGSTLRIKCESRVAGGRGGKQMVTYASSKFLSPSKLDIVDEQVDRIFESIHDLKSVNKQTTGSEMQKLLDEHFFNLSIGSTDDNQDDDDEYAPIRNEKADKVIKSSQEIHEIFEDVKPSASAEKHSGDNSGTSGTSTVPVNVPKPSEEETTDEKLKKLLEDL